MGKENGQGVERESVSVGRDGIAYFLKLDTFREMGNPFVVSPDTLDRLMEHREDVRYLRSERVGSVIYGALTPEFSEELSLVEYVALGMPEKIHVECPRTITVKPSN